MSIEPNIFKFATSELSQDAFICWLVSHLEGIGDMVIQECAKDFLVMLYNLDPKTDALERNGVRIDLVLGSLKQQYCKTDVYFQVSINGKVVSFIIEDKTHTSHHSEQLKKYREAIEKDGQEEEEIIGVYFKTGYMFARDQEAETIYGYRLLGYKEIHEFLQKYSTDHVIFESYKEFIKENYYDRYEQNKRRWEAGDYGCFQYDFAQWEFMRELQGKCEAAIPEKEGHHLYNGTNPNGVPWTQFRFIQWEKVYVPDVNEYVFYRLDKLGSDKYYLSLRQYGNVKAKGDEEQQRFKRMRLGKYREIFKSIIKGGNLQFEEKLGNRGVNESEIGVLFFDKEANTPNAVLEEMGRIHAGLVAAVKDDAMLQPGR